MGCCSYHPLSMPPTVVMQINRSVPHQPLSFMPLDAARASSGAEESPEIMELPEEDATFALVQVRSVKCAFILAHEHLKFPSSSS